MEVLNMIEARKRPIVVKPNTHLRVEVGQFTLHATLGESGLCTVRLVTNGAPVDVQSDGNSVIITTHSGSINVGDTFVSPNVILRR